MLFFPLITDLEYFNYQEIGVKELYEMFKLVTETWGHPAVVVDYDDLIGNPGKALQYKLCFTLSHQSLEKVFLNIGNFKNLQFIFKCFYGQSILYAIGVKI